MQHRPICLTHPSRTSPGRLLPRRTLPFQAALDSTINCMSCRVGGRRSWLVHSPIVHGSVQPLELGRACCGARYTTRAIAKMACLARIASRSVLSARLQAMQPTSGCSTYTETDSSGLSAGGAIQCPMNAGLPPRGRCDTKKI
jgi:hypothetical protein